MAGGIVTQQTGHRPKPTPPVTHTVGVSQKEQIDKNGIIARRILEFGKRQVHAGSPFGLHRRNGSGRIVV